MSKKIGLFSALLLFCLSFFFLPGGIGAIQAKAAGSTYYVKYNGTDWRYQKQELWANTDPGRELYYMYLDMADGDSIIIDGSESSATCVMDFGTKKPGTISIFNGNANITAPSIDNAYLQSKTTTVLNADVANAHIYSNAVANFNKNVGVLEIAAVSDPLINYTGSFGVAGTVDKMVWTTKGTETKAFFDFKAGKAAVKDGDLATEAIYYSTTPSGVTTVAPSTATSEAANADEYDAVPKTGDFSMIPVFFTVSCIAAALIGFLFRKKVAR